MGSGSYINLSGDFMDYFEIIKKAQDMEAIIRENEELKAKLAQVEAQVQPTLTLESSVVQAFKESPEYISLELQAFNLFLQEKFINEFKRSPQATQLVEAAKERFKVFELQYNQKKVSGKNGQNDKGSQKQVSTTDSE